MYRRPAIDESIIPYDGGATRAVQISPRAPRRLPMEKFVERQNIARYTELLITTSDPTKRKMLQRLLAEENVKEGSHLKRSLEDQ